MGLAAVIWKVAVTVEFELRVNTQEAPHPEADPVPDQVMNVDPPAGVSAQVTTVPVP